MYREILSQTSFFVWFFSLSMIFVELSSFMRFHVLGIPHTVSNKEYVACAFTQKVVKFCEMMMPQTEKERKSKHAMTVEELVQHKTIHSVFHYGHERSSVEADELITVITDDILVKTYGNYDWRKEFFKHETGDLAHATFTTQTIAEIAKRLNRGDFLLCFWGLGHSHVARFFENRCIVVEPGIGYSLSSSFDAPYKVFESYAIMHVHYGARKISNPSWYDCVIPNYFSPNDFEFREKKEDYFLYLGRIMSDKGLEIAIQLAKDMGFRLLIAGQGNLANIGHNCLPPNIEYVGFADAEKRKSLMAGAKALFLPSYYLEPFGGVTIEAMLSGTPVITTDWGAFPETVLHGITGFRCRTVDHFVFAVRNIEKLSARACRDWAMNNYSMSKVRAMYEEYFDMLFNLWRHSGFYEKNPNRTQLNWLYRQYPPPDCAKLIASERESASCTKLSLEPQENLHKVEHLESRKEITLVTALFDIQREAKGDGRSVNDYLHCGIKS